MKIKKCWIIAIGIFVLLGILLFLARSSEDSWIKDEKGIYVKHGVPSSTPDYVVEQQEAIACAYEKFDSFSEIINSQCLGTCGDYAVDLVHVPRIGEDDITGNQCPDYANGLVSHFIELDKNREIVRIV